MFGLRVVREGLDLDCGWLERFLCYFLGDYK